MDDKTLSMFSENRIAKIRSVVANRQGGFAIVLEDVHDPHNAAAIMRTADSLGITDFRLVFSKEPPYDPKLIGKASSSSANKWMDFKVYSSIDECADHLKREEYEFVVTTLAPGAKPIDSADLSAHRIAVVFGNEHSGVSAEAAKRADTSIYIPMLGMVQSLNVSVSAAIVIAEITRRRKTGGWQSYLLDSETREKLVENYLSR